MKASFRPNLPLWLKYRTSIHFDESMTKNPALSWFGFFVSYFLFNLIVFFCAYYVIVPPLPPFLCFPDLFLCIPVSY